LGQLSELNSFGTNESALASIGGAYNFKRILISLEGSEGKESGR
jgi:hypothetical protein